MSQAARSEQVRSGARDGVVVDLSGGGSLDAHDPDADWGFDRQVPADVLLEILTTADAVHPRGVRIRGARIVGGLAWDWQRLAVPLELIDCVIDEQIVLDHAQLAGLTLIRCRVAGLSGNGLNSSSSLTFRDCDFAGSVLLSEARVQGGVFAPGSTIRGDRHRDGEPVAFWATRLQITGALALENGFTAHGSVILLGARIGSDLYLSGGRFLNPGADALKTADAEISGSVTLGEGFESVGRLFLSRTQVAGNFTCDGARLDGAGADALKADRIEIRGGLFMRQGFRASGRIRLLGARIGGSLECTDGSFDSAGGEDSIWAGGAQIEGSVLLRGDFRSLGRVRLVDAQIGGSLVGDGAALVNPAGQALRAVNLRVAGDVRLGSAASARAFGAEGEISFDGARIGGSVACLSGTFVNPGGTALDFANADIRGSLWLRTGIDGALRLVRASVGGDLSCRTGSVSGDLVARGMSVAGSFGLGEGPVPPRSLDLRRARVGQLDDDESAWPGQDRLLIEGFSYERLTARAPRSPQARISWIRRQPGYAPEPYQQLAAVYRRSGEYAEATLVAIAQQDDLRRRGDLSRPARAWNWFLGRSIGHGYRPGRAAWALLALYVVTFVSVWLGARSDAFIQVGNTAPQPTVTASRCGDAYPCFIPAAYTLENITPILNLHQAENWQPRSSTAPERLLRDWLYLSIVIGYGGTTLLVAGLSGLARSA